MNFLKTVWEKLNYKKRNIALIYWSVVVPGMIVIWPDGYPAGFPLALSKAVAIFGLFLSALGLGHAAVKSYRKSNASSNTEPTITEEPEVTNSEVISEEVKDDVKEPSKEDSKPNS